jgi:hypothetical protein
MARNELKQLIETQKQDRREGSVPRKWTEDEPEEIDDDEEEPIIEDEDGRGEIVVEDEEIEEDQ